MRGKLVEQGLDTRAREQRLVALHKEVARALAQHLDARTQRLALQRACGLHTCHVPGLAHGTDAIPPCGDHHVQAR